MTTGAVTGNDDDVNVSDNGDNIPNMSSPVAHLWTSNDDCRPLVRPEDATSTGMLHAQLNPTNFNLGFLKFLPVILNLNRFPWFALMWRILASNRSLSIGVGWPGTICRVLGAAWLRMSSQSAFVFATRYFSLSLFLAHPSLLAW